MNTLFGWIWIDLGLLAGLLLGLGFLREGFLGGYAAPRRRLVRLGHVAFIGTGALNLLFATTAERLGLADPWLSTASAGLIVGAVAMPLACGLVAWRQGLLPVFVVPVVSLIGAVTAIILGAIS